MNKASLFVFQQSRPRLGALCGLAGLAGLAALQACSAAAPLANEDESNGGQTSASGGATSSAGTTSASGGSAGALVNPSSGGSAPSGIPSGGSAGSVATASGGGPSSGSGGASTGSAGASTGGAGATTGSGGASTVPTTQFGKVSALLGTRCAGSKCHGTGAKQLAFANATGSALHSLLTTPIATSVSHCQGVTLVAPNDANSPLLKIVASGGKIACTKPKAENIGPMPEKCTTTSTSQTGVCLNTTEIKTLSDWIAAGAPQN